MQLASLLSECLCPPISCIPALHVSFAEALLKGCMRLLNLSPCGIFLILSCAGQSAAWRSWRRPWTAWGRSQPLMKTGNPPT